MMRRAGKGQWSNMTLMTFKWNGQKEKNSYHQFKKVKVKIETNDRILLRSNFYFSANNKNAQAYFLLMVFAKCQK